MSLDSGTLKEQNPPTARMAAVMRMGMALLMLIRFPKATFPKMAATRPRHDRNPNAVVLHTTQRTQFVQRRLLWQY